MARFHLKSAIFCFAAASVYLLFSLQYSGPAYLADEIGYLNNAAFLAGRYSDGASSYYAGFSLIIAPLFHFLSDPRDVWFGVLAANSVMWGLTLFLVALLLKRLLPEASTWRVGFSLLVLAMYPAYLTMSGYALSQTAFSFVFTAAVYALTRLDVRRSVTVLPHAVLVGFLCWVHPVGLAVAVASCMCLFLAYSRPRRFFPPIVNAVVVVAVAALYIGVLQPWMIERMTPAGGSASLHYQASFPLLREGLSLERMKVALSLVAGQLSYLLVATFGFIVAGTQWAFLEMKRAWNAMKTGPSQAILLSNIAIPAFLVLSVIGILAETTLASATPSRFDQWIYGRYVEPIICILFGIGLLSRMSRAGTLMSASFVLLTGIWLVHGMHIVVDPLYPMNIPAWWPKFTHLGSTPMSWFAVGALGIAVAPALNRILAGILILVAFGFCADAQRSWHRLLLADNSNPSSIPAFVRENYGSGVCVGFDHSSASLPGLPALAVERANMYSFYLFDSPMVRMKPKSWLSTCAGPLLTFNGNLSIPGAEFVGRETASNLYVLVRKNGRKLSFPNEEPGEQYWKDSQSERCLVAGCFSVDGQRLLAYHMVGTASGTSLQTDGRTGYLLFGPYVFLAKGNYVLELMGDFRTVDGAKLDVVDGASITYAASNISDLVSADRRTVRLPFSIPDKADRLEIRIAVSQKDDIRLDGYRVQAGGAMPMQTGAGSPMPAVGGSKPILMYGPDELALLPRQVGVAGRSGVHSDGRAGFLLYGPYSGIPPGRYVLQVKGESKFVAGSWVEVVSGKGSKTHLRVPIGAKGDGEESLVRAEFTIDAETDSLEVRAIVGEGDEIALSGYSVLHAL